MVSELASLQNATNRAYRAIKEMISRYELVPGQKIIYDQLVEKISLSKTPIINALNRLEQEEFVFSIPNRGFFIKAINVEEVAELFEVREALERHVIATSIKNYDPKMLKEIEKAMVAHREYHYEIVTRKRLALDASFHLRIAEMGRNKNLTRILKHVFEHIYLRHRSEQISPQRLIESAEEHRAIFDAIKEKNLSKAKRLMVQHVRAGKIVTIKGVQKAAVTFDF